MEKHFPKYCKPGKGCFTCPYPDCKCSTRNTSKEETAMRKGTAKDTEGKGSDAKWTYKKFVTSLWRLRPR